jgi:hypothetical protein
LVRSLQFLNNSNTIWTQVGFFAALWHVLVETPISCDSLRKDFCGEASSLFFTSCTVSSGIFGRPPSWTSNNVPVVSSFYTRYWMVNFAGGFRPPNWSINCLWHAFIDSVFQYVWTINTRCSTVYQFISARNTQTQWMWTPQYTTPQSEAGTLYWLGRWTAGLHFAHAWMLIADQGHLTLHHCISSYGACYSKTEIETVTPDMLVKTFHNMERRVQACLDANELRQLL